MRIQQKNFKMALNHSLIQDLKHKIIAKEFCKNFSHAKETSWLVFPRFKHCQFHSRGYFGECKSENAIPSVLIWVKAQIIHMVSTVEWVSLFCYIHILPTFIKYLLKIFEVFDYTYTSEDITLTNKVQSTFCFFLITHYKQWHFYILVSINITISCVGFWACLSSELLKLPHAHTSNDFSYAQLPVNGVTGSVKYKNEFHRTCNPLNCQLSSHHVIACNCYHHSNGCFISSFKKKMYIFCYLSYLYVSEAALYDSIHYFLPQGNSLTFNPTTKVIFMKDYSPMKLLKNSAERMSANVPSFHPDIP